MKELLLVIVCLVAGLANAQKPYYGGEGGVNEQLPDEPIVHSMYLIGDAGEPDFSKPAALKLLERHIGKGGNKSTVVFLGDNVYPAGIPEEEVEERKLAEQKLKGSLDALKNYEGRIVFVPGNHDWDHWGVEGLAGIRREEKFIEEKLPQGNTFLPDNGCPGPAVVEITPNMVLVALDTQWWLHMNEKPEGEESSCPTKSDEEFLKGIETVLEEHKGKKIVFVAHHPLVSNGYHGGYFPLREHLFPLTAKYKWLYLPVPVLGSIYVFFRQWFGHIQDIPNPRYELLCKSLLELFSKYEGVVYAAGHDHNLQHHVRGKQNHIVSGSGSKISPVAKKHDALFTYARQGFMVLKLTKTGQLWLEAVVVGDQIAAEGKVVYRRKL